MAWRAWYADGSVYSSAETSVEALPATGMIGGVVYGEPPYRVIVNGGDWYWWTGEKWKTTGNSIWGDWVDPPDDIPDEHLKRSGSLPNEEWAAVRQAMHDSKDWPD